MRSTVDVCLSSILYDPEYSGPALRFRRYAPGLASRGVKIRVFCASWPKQKETSGRSPVGHHQPLREIVDSVLVDRVAVPERNASGRTYRHYYRMLAQYCLQRDTRPEVLQLLNIERGCLRLLWSLRQAGVPTVFTYTMLPGYSRDSPIGHLKDLKRSLPLQLLDCIVVSSSIMREDLRRIRVKTRIEVIPNGVDLERFRPAPPRKRRELRRRLGFDEDAQLIVFLGGFLCRRKGVDVLADAWGRVGRERSRARLVLVGAAEKEFQPKEGRGSPFAESIERALDASGARERVIFTGLVDNVEEYLQIADVFVFPSRREGMPNAVLEAYASGVPTILTPFLGLSREFGRPGDQYVLAERTPRALASAILQLLSDQRRREVLSRSARRWAENELDVKKSLDRYADLYRELANRSQQYS